uniref:SCAN box domain-containing protein n=1 Tax=Crocodylus porosus TaxID=8502 RepID=A0A7M4EWJ0_CROPO
SLAEPLNAQLEETQELGAMTQDEALNHDKMKREILYWLDISPETYRQAFQAKKKQEEKALRALLQRLSDLVTKWLKPADSLKGEICTKILLEQFLVDLHEEIFGSIIIDLGQDLYLIWGCKKVPILSALRREYRGWWGWTTESCMHFRAAPFPAYVGSQKQCSLGCLED